MLLLIPLASAYVPEDNTRPEIVFELGGSAGVGSLNATFAPQPTLPWMRLRFGFSAFPIDPNNGWVVVTPAMIEVESPGRVAAFGGAGLGLSVTTRLQPHVRGVLSAGLRVRPGNRVFAGLAYTPLVSFIADRQWQHWAGAQVGVVL